MGQRQSEETIRRDLDELELAASSTASSAAAPVPAASELGTVAT